MDWQLLTAGIAVGLAGFYLVVRGWRTWRGSKAGCSGGCGCAKKGDGDAKPTVIAPEAVVLRKR